MKNIENMEDGIHSFNEYNIPINNPIDDDDSYKKKRIGNNIAVKKYRERAKLNKIKLENDYKDLQIKYQQAISYINNLEYQLYIEKNCNLRLSDIYKNILHKYEKCEKKQKKVK